MKTRAFALITLIVCMLFATASIFAHGGEQHVIGTVAQIGADSITVKTTAGKIVTVSVVPATKFTMNNGKMAMNFDDLKVGNRVVIHAKEPREGTLVADTVEFAEAKPAQTSATP